MSIFSERLKFLRKEKKLTQTELAKMLNTTQGTVGKWENNKLEPNFKKLILLAKYLSVSTDYLLGVTNIKGERSIMFSFFKRDKEKEVQTLPNIEIDNHESYDFTNSELKTLEYLVGIQIWSEGVENCKNRTAKNLINPWYIWYNKVQVNSNYCLEYG